MKKNQERRLHRKNAKIVKEGGTPMQLSRPLKPDTTVSFNGDSKRIDTYSPFRGVVAIVVRWAT
jgi:hypothetical protein